jgi:hypothetical protein
MGIKFEKFCPPAAIRRNAADERLELSQPPAKPPPNVEMPRNPFCPHIARCSSLSAFRFYWDFDF